MWVAPACAVALVGAAFACRRRALAVAAALLCLVAGLSTAGMRVVGLRVGQLDELANRSATVTATAVVTADPWRHIAATQGTRRGGELWLVPLRLERAVARGVVHRGRWPVLALARDRTWAHLLPGQRLVVAGSLRPALPRQPLSAALSVRGPPRLTGDPPRVQRAAGHLRAGLRAAVSDLAPAERGLVPGLVVGDTSRMLPELEGDFRTAGMTHLTAVSGANLVIVCGFVLYVGRWLGARGRALPFLGALALVGFVVLARPQPSVLRAAAMGAVALGALATGRRRVSLAALGAAILVVLMLDPWLARSFGFALSVLATGGLLVLAPPIAGWLHARRMPMILAQAVAVPLGAQLACAPVIVLLAGQVSLVAVPANLLAAPAVAPATLLGLLATLTAPVSAGLAAVLGQLSGVPAMWIVEVAGRAATAPLSALSWPASTVGALVLAALLAVALVLGRRAAAQPSVIAAAVVVVVGVSAAGAASPGWPPTGWLVVACDVGQGDALVLSAGSAGAVVVDAGPEPRAVDRCLRRLGVRRVALVVLTHLHADHVEGLPGVLRGRSVGGVELGPDDGLPGAAGEDENTGSLRRIEGWSRAAGVPVGRAVVGERVQIGPLSWQVLWPARRIPGDGAENNASLVLFAERAGVRVLLTGDIEPPAQKALLARWRWGTVDVLKVAHHGSAFQDPRLLATLRPQVALVSAGVDNDYGHPAPTTLRVLQGQGTLVGRTDHDGDLAVVGSPGRVQLVTAGR